MVRSETFSIIDEKFRGFNDNPSQSQMDSFNIKGDVIESIKTKFNNKVNFEENWIGAGGGQEEMAKDVWVRMINRINSLKNVSGHLYDINIDGQILDTDIDRIIKLFLINLDKPITDDGKIPKYPKGICLDGNGIQTKYEAVLTDEAACSDQYGRTWNTDDGIGWSPLDIFLYNDSQGINAAQLEALL